MHSVSPQQAIAGIRQRFRDRARSIYVAGCSGTPSVIAAAFTAVGAPDDQQTETFEGVWIPGIDTIDWAQIHDTARSRSIFVGPAWRNSFVAGRFDFAPHTYAQAFRRFTSETFDAAFCVVTPPAVDGRVSLGVSADFSRPAVEMAKLSIAIVNPNMPRPFDGVTLPLDQFDFVIDAPAALPKFADSALGDSVSAIGQHIAGIIEAQRRPTLQLGLGKVQQAVLEALKTSTARDLKLHAGMISTPLLGLLEAGKISAGSGAITCGVALGSQALYARAADDGRFRFRDVGDTHAAATLAAIPGLIAINSAIEVDLFGQANAEFIGTKQVSGGGGLTDFLAGAQASDGGLAIVALNASAKGGARSRIVPRLTAPAVSVPRTLVDCVVTEYGIAWLAGKDLEGRAQALIGIAAPGHRDALANDWAEIRSAM